jgi:hypothetical protein
VSRSGRVVERKTLQTVGEGGKLANSAARKIKLQMFGSIVIGSKTGGILELAFLRPEHIAITRLFGVGYNYRSVSDLHECSAVFVHYRS